MTVGSRVLRRLCAFPSCRGEGGNFSCVGAVAYILRGRPLLVSGSTFQAKLQYGLSCILGRQ